MAKDNKCKKDLSNNSCGGYTNEFEFGKTLNKVTKEEVIDTSLTKKELENLSNKFFSKVKTKRNKDGTFTHTFS